MYYIVILFSFLLYIDTIFFSHIDPTFYSLNVECLWVRRFFENRFLISLGLVL